MELVTPPFHNFSPSKLTPSLHNTLIIRTFYFTLFSLSFLFVSSASDFGT